MEKIVFTNIKLIPVIFLFCMTCFAQGVDSISLDNSKINIMIKSGSKTLSVALPKKFDPKYLYYNVEQSFKNPKAINIHLWRIVPLEKFSEAQRSLFELKSWFVEVNLEAQQVGVTKSDFAFVPSYELSCWGSLVSKQTRINFKIDSIEGFGKSTGILNLELSKLE